MRVSAVLPVYNGETHLRQTLESVFAQTYKNLELVVVDDGSTDASLSLLSQYADNLRLFIQKNSGVSAARNRGAEEAQGELVAFIDQDDIWHTHKIARQVEVFRAHPEVSFVYSDVELIDDRGNITARHGLRTLDIDWIRPFLKGHFHPYPSTVMIKRNVFLRHGGFSRDFIGNLHEDVELWARICMEAQFYFIDEPLVQYRWDEQARKERAVDPYRLLQNSITLHDKLKDLYEEHPEMRAPLRQLREKFEVRLHGMIGKNLATEGNFVEARKHFYAAWRVSKTRKNLTRYLRTFLPERLHSVWFPR